MYLHFKHKQTDTSAETGDCLRACVAGLLGLNMNQVPNFNDGSGKTILKFEQYLAQRQLLLLSCKAKTFQATAGVMGIAALKSTPYLDGLHAVVFRVKQGNRIMRFYDPNPAITFQQEYDLQPKEIVRLYIIVPR